MLIPLLRMTGLKDNGAPLHLLIVDDDDVSREVLCLMAEGEGYRVAAAESGDEALRHVGGPGAPAPDIILTDLQMPGVTGNLLAEALRAACGPRPLLFAMSGSIPGEPVLSGFDGFLRKPFTMAQLQEALAGHRATQPVPAAAAGMLDQATYDLLEQTMGPEQLGKLFDMCLSDAATRVETMRLALAEEDGIAYRRAAHAIKGGCGLVGAVELYRLANELELNGLGDGSLDSLDRFVAASERLQRMLAPKL